LDLFLPFLAAGLVNGAIGAAVRIDEFLAFDRSSVDLGGFVVRLFVVVASLGILNWVTSTIANGVAVKYSLDLLEKREADLRRSFDFTLSRLVPLLGAGVLSVVLIILGLICLVVPGIILAVMFSLVVPTIMIEGINAFESLGRSRRLVSKRWKRTFAVILIIFIIQGIVSSVGSTIGSPLGPFSWIIANVANALIQPLLPLATTFLYYSMRIKETGEKEITEKPTFFCPNCGQPVTSEDSFCRSCGARLTNEAS
jgi:predicted RNA-binding Zn-ribbon protein involved in translation (DUF1610 family)